MKLNILKNGPRWYSNVMTATTIFTFRLPKQLARTLDLEVKADLTESEFQSSKVREKKLLPVEYLAEAGGVLSKHVHFKPI